MWKCRNRACNTGNYDAHTHCALCGERRRPEWTEGSYYVRSIEGRGIVTTNMKKTKALVKKSLERAARDSRWDQKILRGLAQSKAGATKTLAEFRESLKRG